MAIVRLDNGQEIPVEDTIAGSDELLREVLSTFYAPAPNAKISRETQEGKLIVNVVKVAEQKGSPLAQLIGVAEAINPAMLKVYELQLLRQQGEWRLEPCLDNFFTIAEAYEAGIAEFNRTNQILKALREAPPEIASVVPAGF